MGGLQDSETLTWWGSKFRGNSAEALERTQGTLSLSLLVTGGFLEEVPLGLGCEGSVSILKIQTRGVKSLSKESSELIYLHVQ